MQKAVVGGINRGAGFFRLKKSPLAKAERDLNRAEKLIELYEPFILHNEQVFECENARLLSAALPPEERDRKSTRLNSSHSQISYAVFCLKKKKTKACNTEQPLCSKAYYMSLLLCSYPDA